MKRNFEKWFKNYFNSEWIDKHRSGISDLDWAKRQPKADPNYSLGDVVEFKAGGFGIITKVSKPQNGWPSSYATDAVKGMKDHPKTKRAWHYELDFKKRVGKTVIVMDKKWRGV